MLTWLGSLPNTSWKEVMQIIQRSLCEFPNDCQVFFPQSC
ncbi:MAG: hypothetical protein OJF51_003924 [Nitrospira sp.]|nr:MAG: hypothetical protein OJF51_003924 [Nitrospira sp.]